MYKTYFDKHYGRWIKELLLISISGTPETASNFSRWYIGVTEPDKTELNIVMCEVHKYNVSTKIWRIVLDSLTINFRDFDRVPIVSQKSAMEQLSKSSSICNSEVNKDLVKLQNYCEEFIFPLKHHTQSTESRFQ